MMIAQKYWDDTPLRNVDFSVAWARVQPAERPCPIDRINAMECVFLGALGFDLYIPEIKYVACIDELARDQGPRGSCHVFNKMLARFQL